MQYFNLLAITAQSAASTLAICTRQSVKDSRKVWGWYHATFLGSEATQRYQEIGKIIGTLACIAIALGQIARIHADAWVDAQLEQPTHEPAQALLPAAKPLLALPPAKEPAPAPAKKRGRPRKEVAATPAPKAPAKARKPRAKKVPATATA